MAEQRATGGASLASRSDRLKEINGIHLMFCIQTCVLETFDQQVACAKGADLYPFPRAAFVGTGTAKDAAGIPKLKSKPPKISQCM